MSQQTHNDSLQKLIAIPPRMSVPPSLLELCRDSSRGTSKSALREMWLKALEDNFLLAMQCLFYIRDIQEGRGEKRIFILAIVQPWGPANSPLERKRIKLLNSEEFWLYVAKYGSWKTVIDISFPMMENFFSKFKVDSSKPVLKKDREIVIDENQFNPFILLNLFKKVLKGDTDSPKGNISTLSKWLPRDNKSLAKKFPLTQQYLIEVLGNKSPYKYRKLLVELGKKLDIVERYMCARRWDDINFDKVPVCSRRKYKKAFKRHIKSKYKQWLEKKAASYLASKRKTIKGKSKKKKIDNLLSLKSAVEVNPRYEKIRDLEQLFK